MTENEFLVNKKQTNKQTKTKTKWYEDKGKFLFLSYQWKKKVLESV